MTEEINAKIKRARDNLDGMIEALAADDMPTLEKLLDKWNTTIDDRTAIIQLKEDMASHASGCYYGGEAPWKKSNDPEDCDCGWHE